jgi:acyl carrier protein
MGKLFLQEVKENLSKEVGFSAFIYLKGGRFVYDSEFKEGCVGVISSELGQLFGGFGEDVLASFGNFPKVIQENNLDETKKDEISSQNEEKKDKKPVKTLRNRRTFRRKPGSKYMRSKEPEISIVFEEKARLFVEERDAFVSLVCDLIRARMCYYALQNYPDDLSDCAFKNDLGLDSMDEIEVIMGIEKEVGIRISGELEELMFSSYGVERTANSMVDYLIAEMKKKL